VWIIFIAKGSAFMLSISHIQLSQEQQNHHLANKTHAAGF
jgi:hypothetical protein